MPRRASFTSVLVECYSTVGGRLTRFITKSENTKNPSLWELLFVGRFFLLAAFVLATPVLVVLAAVKWYRLGQVE